MSSIVNAVLPVFALVLVGYVCRRTGRLGPTAASEINKFVVWLALPALLFNVTASSTWAQVWQPGFLASFTLGFGGVFIGMLFWRLKRSRRLVDASIDGLGASYANTGFMGIPLCLLLFGSDGLEPALVATLLVACVLFAITVVCIEIGLQAEQRFHHTLLKVAKALVTNPLVIAPILGGCWAVGGVMLPEPVAQFLKLLGAAAAPCALVSLGLFLAQKQEGQSEGVVGQVLAKLILQPLITWFCVFHLFHLAPAWANSAVLLSALPTGTGPFMLAEFYQREATVVARVILFSTLGSLVTISALLYLLGL